MGFLVQEEEEEEDDSSSSSSSSSSSIGFVVKHPMQGLRIPNHLSPRFVVFKVCMHGIFSYDAQSLMQWISTQLPQQTKETLRQCLKKSGKRLRHHMTMLPYDWSFRYLLKKKGWTPD
jgi:hypothetical protein